MPIQHNSIPKHIQHAGMLLFFGKAVFFSSSVVALSSALRTISNDNALLKMTFNETLSHPDIITIPLIPHRVQRRRHLQLARKLEQEDREAGYPARGSRYHRNMQEDTDEGGHFQSQQVAALYQGYGTHYADLWCGSPPQRQTVIVDTGSSVTAFPCANCHDCGESKYHIDALYAEGDSNTFKSLTCDECLSGSCSHNSCKVTQDYAEYSGWKAFEAMDLCYVGGMHNMAVDTPALNDKDDLNPFNANLFAFKMKFGCQTELWGLFKTQLADGIMGMDVAEPSYWWQMYASNKIAHKSFSLCFSRHDEADRSGTESGAMSLGGTDTRLHETKMIYSSTQDEGGSGFYVVHVKKVWLREPDGGSSALATKSNMKHTLVNLSESVLNGERGVIVDSGTTDTYFSRQFGVAFQEAWKEVMGTPYSQEPLDMTAEELSRTQPTILFQLSGDFEINKDVKEKSGETVLAGLANDLDPDSPYDVILAIPPSHYYEYDEEINKYVSRFYVDHIGGGLLGANAMMGHDVYFDVERNRIGWAESNCDYSGMVDTYMNGYVPQESESSIDNTDIKNSKPDATKPISSIPLETEGDVDVDRRGSSNESKPDGFCSGFFCEMLVTAIVMSGVVGIAWKLVRKAPSDPSYDLALGNEVELTTVDDNGFDDNTGYINENGKSSQH